MARLIERYSILVSLTLVVATKDLAQVFCSDYQAETSVSSVFAPPASGWSVELSQVTTLPPLGQDYYKTYAVKPSKQLAQESIFDDSREFSIQQPDVSTRTRQSGVTASPLPLVARDDRDVLNAPPTTDNSTRWTPTKVHNSPDLAYALEVPKKINGQQQPVFGRTIPPTQQQTRELVTLELLNAFLRQNPVPLLPLASNKIHSPIDDSPIAAARPQQPKVISKELLQKALAIQSSLEGQLRQNNQVGVSTRTSDAPQRSPIKALKIFNGKNLEQQPGEYSKRPGGNQMRRWSKSTNSNELHSESGSPRQETAAHRFNELLLERQMAHDHYLMSMDQLQPAYSLEPPLLAEARHSGRMDGADEERSASHHFPVHHYAYPAAGAYVGHAKLAISPKHEKGLVTPILVGVVAALLSFLIISNLFLCIPLFAMTLWQLLGGTNMMMMMPPNNSNQQVLPSTPNQNGNSNQNGQQTLGRRRKRQAHDEEARILRTIERLTQLYAAN